MLIDWQKLVDDAAGVGICETDNGIPLPVATVRRLCCDAEILPAVLGADGEILDAGRSARTANRAQRRALRAMHRGCAHPDQTLFHRGPTIDRRPTENSTERPAGAPPADGESSTAIPTRAIRSPATYQITSWNAPNSR